MQRIITHYNRRLLSALFIVTLIIVGGLWLITRDGSAINPIQNVGSHYARIISPAVASVNRDELNRLLNSMITDEHIIKAAVYAPDGNLLAQQGNHQALADLIRANPARQAPIIPVTLNHHTIGYLHWVTEPKTAR